MKKKLQHIIIAVLSFILVLGGSITAFAVSGSIRLSPSSSSVSPGSTFTVTGRVTASGGGIGSFTSTVSFDSSKLEVTGASGSISGVSTSTSSGAVNILYYDPSGGSNPITGTKSAFKITFRVKSGASGTASISASGGDFTDANGNSVGGSGGSCSVKISSSSGSSSGGSSGGSSSGGSTSTSKPKATATQKSSKTPRPGETPTPTPTISPSPTPSPTVVPIVEGTVMDTITLESLQQYLNANAGKDVNIQLKAPLTLGADMLSAIRTAGANASFSVVGADNVPQYTWSFAGDSLPENPVALNLALDQNAEQLEAIQKKADGMDVTVLNFQQKGDLGAQVSMRVYVGDKYEDGTTLTLYTYDAEKDEFVKVEENLTVEGGYVSFETETGETYLLSSDKLVPTTILGLVPYGGTFMEYALIGILVILLAIIALMSIKIKKLGDQVKYGSSQPSSEDGGALRRR